jgi:cyclophilin family peptidyl-prolyl cis-trans isomerase
MTMRRRLLLSTLAAVALTAAAPPAKPLTPSEIVKAAPAAAWRTIDPNDLMIIDLKNGGRVIAQLAPQFAPVHVANIRALAKGGWWSGAAVYRVQDNYVAQWGNNDSKKDIPQGVVAKPPAEYERPLRGLTIHPLGSPDAYAPRAGFTMGWPVAYDPKAGTANLPHCYGSVGVGRDLSPDTGMGGELYAAIGHAPRHLDRVIAVVGRVVEGIENFSALPRGTEALGFYKERSFDVPIARVTLAADMPASERPSFQYMDTQSPSFAAYVKGRANRKDDFYIRPAGGVDLCNAPVPIRRTPAN